MSSLGTLPYFLSYFGTAVLLLGLFLLIYTRITRHDEWALLEQGNTAASVSLAGAAMGFALPLASVITHAVSFVDLLVWSVVAMLVQLLAYALIYALRRDVSTAISRGDMAPAVMLGAGGVVLGVLNAACLTY